MSRLFFNREVRELLLQYAGIDGVLEATDDGFISHVSDPIVVPVSDEDVWSLMPLPARVGADIRRYGRPVYCIDATTITPVMARIWTNKVAELCGHPVDCVHSSEGVMLLTSGDTFDVNMTIVVLEPLLGKLQCAVIFDLDGLELRYGCRPTGGQPVDPNTHVEWID